MIKWSLKVRDTGGSLLYSAGGEDHGGIAPALQSITNVLLKWGDSSEEVWSWSNVSIDLNAPVKD